MYQLDWRRVIPGGKGVKAMIDKQTPKKFNPCILLAIDGSRAALQAVNYAAYVTFLIPKLEFVLLEILPPTPPYMADAAKTDGRILAKMKKLKQINTARAVKNLEDARGYLIRHGIEPERIVIKTRPRVGGLAQDIITEAEQGSFDALVVGRRGLTRTQELFMGSVSNQLVQHAANVPLWIIDGVIREPKVLVAVDGSPASLRAVDHIAFMLGQNPEAEVTFLHVLPKFQNYCPIDSGRNEADWAEIDKDLELLEEEFRRDEQICLGDFFLRATKILGQAGFSQDRIRFEERAISLGVARTIIKEAKDLGCGTIVVGRRGMGKSSFLGGVSDRVIRRANELAVWLVN